MNEILEKYFFCCCFIILDFYILYVIVFVLFSINWSVFFDKNGGMNIKRKNNHIFNISTWHSRLLLSPNSFQPKLEI